VSSFLTAHQHN